MQLRRLTTSPILEPIPSHQWERAAVLNCASAYHNGLYHLLYRGCDEPFKGPRPSISAIGYAVSEDGINFNRMSEPIFKGEGEWEGWGVEDPRLTMIDGTFHMLYTAFRGPGEDPIRVCRATTTDFINWNREGIVLDEVNKDAGLFPRKIGDRYWLIHRRWPSIWIASSTDMKNWSEHKIILEPVPGTWESHHIGLAGPPIEIAEGWLLIYHGVDDNNAYCLGAALLEKEDPSVVLARQSSPILSPELPWEKIGLIPNVVFSCGAAETADALKVYYGGADTVVGVAEIKKEDIVFTNIYGKRMIA